MIPESWGCTKTRIGHYVVSSLSCFMDSVDVTGCSHVQPVKTRETIFGLGWTQCSEPVYTQWQSTALRKHPMGGKKHSSIRIWAPPHDLYIIGYSSRIRAWSSSIFSLWIIMSYSSVLDAELNFSLYNSSICSYFSMCSSTMNMEMDMRICT